MPDLVPVVVTIALLATLVAVIAGRAVRKHRSPNAAMRKQLQEHDAITEP